MPEISVLLVLGARWVWLLLGLIAMPYSVRAWWDAREDRRTLHTRLTPDPASVLLARSVERDTRALLGIQLINVLIGVLSVTMGLPPDVARALAISAIFIVAESVLCYTAVRGQHERATVRILLMQRRRIAKGQKT